MNLKKVKNINHKNSSNSSFDLTKSRLSENKNLSYLDKTVYILKLILIGEYSVGKTAIISRYIDDYFPVDKNCSLGIEFKIKSINIDDKKKIDLEIWDTCGQDKYKSITKQYFRDKSGAILVYDVTNRKTFEALNNWLKDLKDFATNLNIIVVGNKIDKNFEREVTFMEALNFCQDNNLDYIEVSAFNGINVNELFQKISENFLSNEIDLSTKSKNFSSLNLGKLEHSSSSRISEESDDSFDYSLYKWKKDNSKCC